jgi:hypothetical protein
VGEPWILSPPFGVCVEFRSVKFLLALASTFNFGCGTPDHIFLSHDSGCRATVPLFVIVHLVTARNEVRLEKLIVTHLLKKFCNS